MKIRSLILAVVVLACGSSWSHAETPLPAVVDIQIGESSKAYRFSLNEIYFPAEGIRAVDVQPSVGALKDLLAEVIIASKSNAFLVLYPAAGGNDVSRRVILTDEIVIKANASAASAAGSSSGVQKVERLGFADDLYKVTVTNPANTLEVADELKKINGVDSTEVQLGRAVEKYAVPNDPLFPFQWHLFNYGQFPGSVAGIDLKVKNVWDNYKGQGVMIGVVDDGADLTHEDLVASIDRAVSFDFVQNDNDPSPAAGDFHGTACAGVAAASGFNGLGVSGVAPKADIAIIRLLNGQTSFTTPLQVASVLTYQSSKIDIKSFSFGYTDPFVSVSSTVLDAFENALNTGRGGKGTILVWAAGNSASFGDNANYEYRVNHRGTIAIGALDDKGKIASYSEPGACLIGVAPSGANGRPGITTTDITGSDGYSSDNYAPEFNGTSAACPMVAGVVALMLEAKPQASWNSIQDILIRTARKVDSANSDWITNGAGLNFNHRYGAGLIDAEAAIAGIKSRNSFPKQISTKIDVTGLPLVIPDGNSNGISIPITVNSNIKSLEHVVLKFSAIHSSRGNLDVTLVSPKGTSSKLALQRGDSEDNYDAWPFMTVRNWGEDPNGTWTLKVTDKIPADAGRVTGVTLELYGLSQAPAPLPGGQGGGQPGSAVKVAVSAPKNFAKMSPGQVTFRGTAEAPSGIEKIEFQHLMFATVSDGDSGNPGSVSRGRGDGSLGEDLFGKWQTASGKEAWNFTTTLQKGENRVRVRAVDKDGSTSDLTTMRIMVP